MNTSSATIHLDAVDLQLLRLLQADAGQQNQQLAQAAGVSASTGLRRVRRLESLGLIERRTAILHPDRLALALGHGLQALLEITLERQGADLLDAFEQRAVADPQVQQCWRVAPGPDFILVVHVPDMPAYLALTHRLCTQDANVRNVRTFFSTRRAKFDPSVPLPEAPAR